jgi:broad specificity phosphatase PhoE
MKGRTVIFVRHGESKANVLQHADRNAADLQEKMDALGDPGLSETGVKQADMTAYYLANKLSGSILVLGSKMKRAYRTAQMFHHRRYESRERYTALLNEYTRPSKKLTNEHVASGIVHHKSWDEFTANVVAFVDMMEREVEEETVVVFGHSLFCSVLVTYISSGKQVLPEKDNCVFRFPNASISTFVYKEETKSWRILHTASTAHLGDSIKTGLECDH